MCDVDLLHCTQSCSNATGSDPHCTCNPGYALNNDGVSCQGKRSRCREIIIMSRFLLDINECAVSSLCSHGCHNTNGSFHCSCPNGFFLASDRRNCIGKNYKITIDDHLTWCLSCYRLFQWYMQSVVCYWY